jgi:transcriptional regulator GlxA family with amidase domain
MGERNWPPSWARARKRWAHALGVTPLAFVRQQRLRRARDLLLIQQYNTIAETAYAVGFSGAGHFAKLYRDEFGESPNETLKGTGKKVSRRSA